MGSQDIDDLLAKYRLAHMDASEPDLREPLWWATVRGKVYDFVTHPVVHRVGEASHALLEMASAIGQAGGGPIAAMSAVLSVGRIARQAFDMHDTNVSLYIRHKGLSYSLTSNLPQILDRSGLIPDMNMEVLERSSEDQEELIGVRDHGRIFAFFVSGGTVQDTVYSNEDLEEDADSGWANTLFGQTIRRVLWSKFGSSGVEVVLGGSGEDNGPLLKPLPDRPIHYIGDKDPVAFADEVEIFRQKGVSRAVIFHGPPGGGKTTFVLSYAELTRSKTVMIGPGAYSEMSAGDLETIIASIRPDILLLDDIDKSSDHKIVYTTLPNLRRQYPRLLVVITCNSPSSLGSAFLRPGRGGELVHFPPPTVEERILLLDLYLGEAKVDKSRFDLLALAEAMTEKYTHDWVRLIAEQAVVYDTQDLLLDFIEKTNEKVEFIHSLDDDEGEIVRVDKSKRRRRRRPGF